MLAQTQVYLDTNGTTTGSGITTVGTTVNWNVTTTVNNWTTNLNGNTTTPDDWNTIVAGSKNATFSAGADAATSYTVNVVGTVNNVGGLTFQEGNVTISGGTALTLAQNAVVDVAASRTATISTTINGTNFGLTKSGGTGTLILSGNNGYTGITTVSSGTLRATTNANALGLNTSATALTLSGGSLELANNTALDFARNTTLSATSTITIDKLTSNATSVTHSLGDLAIGAQTLNVARGANITTTGVGGLNFDAVTVSSDSAIFTPAANTALTLASVTYSSGTGKNFTVNGAGNTTISGIVSTGTGSVTYSGSGNLILSGANSYSGTTNVNSGTLIATTSASALGSGTLALAGGNLTLANNTALDFARNTTLSATSTITIDKLTSNSTSVTHSLGDLAIGAQTLNVARGANITTTGVGGLSFDAVTVSSDSATFTPAASTSLTLASVTYSGGTGKSFTSAGAGDTTITGSISTGTGSVTKSGTGNLVFAGVNSYTGTTTISAGTLTVNAGAVLAGSTSSLVVNGGTLNLNNTAQTVSSLTGSGGTINLGSGHTLTVNPTGTNTYAGALTGTGGLTKSGAGSLALTGSNSYSGATTLTSGTLTLKDAGVMTGASAYALNGGTLLIDNTGTANSNARINDASTIALNGGSLIYNGRASTSSTETVGALSGSGNSTITVTAGATGSANLTVSGFTHTSGNSTMLVNGTNLGRDSTTTNAGYGRLLVTATPTLVGTSNAAPTGKASVKDLKIVPFLVGEATAGGFGTQTGTANTFVTWHSTTGLRPMDLTNEFTQNAITAATNTRLTTGTTNAASGATAINSLIMGGGTLAINAAGTLTVSSGALLYSSTGTISSGTLAFGANEAQVTVNSGLIGTIDSQITGSGGLTKSGTGTLEFGNAGNSYTGTTTINSGTLTVKSGGSLADSTSNLVVNTGGTLNLNNAAQTVATLNGTGGTINLGSGHNLTVNGGSTSTWTGNMALPSGNATLTGGANLLILGNGTDFNANTLSLGTNTLTVATPSAATVVPIFQPSPSFVLDAANVVINSQITGTGGITKTGTGTLSIMAGSTAGNTFTGNLTITGGKVVAASNPGLPAIGSNDIFIGNSASTGGGVTSTLQAGQLSASALSNMIGVYNPLTNASSSNLTVYADGLYSMNNGANGFRNLTLKGGLIDGGVDTNHTALTVTGGITTIASPQTAIIKDGNLLMSASNFTFTVAGGGATVGLRVDDLLQNGVGYTAGSSGTSFVKAGTGMMVLSGANGANTYQGITDVSGGILNIQSATALGQVSTLGVVDNGTVVESNAQLQLEKVGGMTIGVETLTLNGNGFSSDGALRNVVGDNTLNGYVYLGSDSRINADAGTTLTIANTNGVDSAIMNGSVGVAASALTIGGAGNVTVNGGISGNITNVNKGTGAGDTGTLTLAGLNGYTGATNVKFGAVKVTHDSGLSGTGATVDAGAALQLAGNITTSNLVGATINGTGVNGGAIENLSGNNTFRGNVTLATASTILAQGNVTSNSTLTITGDISAANKALTVKTGDTAAFNTGITINSTISIGTVAVTNNATMLHNTSGKVYDVINTAPTGAGQLIKDGAGTLTITGNHTSSLDGVTMTLGNLTVGETGTTTIVRSGQLSSTNANNILTINAGSLVDAYYSDTSVGTANTFTGQLAGSGTFQKDGAGILAFNSTINAPNLTLLITGGEIDFKGFSTSTARVFAFGTIHITGDTILDFDASFKTTLTSANLIIDQGVTVTVNNWASETDFWFATSTFVGRAGVDTGVTFNANYTPGTPQYNIHFANWDGLSTAWVNTGPGGAYTNLEIRPIPEPATYGALFFSGCLALLGWRRYSRRSTARQE